MLIAERTVCRAEFVREDVILESNEEPVPRPEALPARLHRQYRNRDAGLDLKQGGELADQPAVGVPDSDHGARLLRRPAASAHRSSGFQRLVAE